MKMTGIKTYRIVLADDHKLFRQSLKKILENTSDIEVVGEAGDGIDLLDLLSRINPHMALIDISMPRCSGFEALSEIEKKHPGLKVLLLTMHKYDAYRERAITIGAEGYLLKDNIDKELFTAITMIRRGLVYFPHLI
jgi:DNA-binding NarL/FixJ family response regulator